MIAIRVLALAIGYLFGIFQTGFLYGKTQGIDIREHGSGNSGTTNTLRTLGWKAAAITYAGDLIKAILAVVVVHFAFASVWEGDLRVLEMYAGFGAVLGHNFPFYLNFKGGKGIACTSGVILAVCPYGAPLCLTLFIVVVLVTRYVSLGSILVVIVFIIQAILFNYFGLYGLEPAEALEYNIIAGCFTVMAIWKHRENIVRLLNGTENKIGKKVEKNE